LLARQEIQLAKVEMKQKASEASAEITTIAIGGFLANAALLALVAALILGLAEFMAAWLAALVVALVVAVVAGLLIWKGVAALKEMNPVPEQTMTTLKEDKEWLSRQLNQ
jgi:UDP-N-acetylmuramyl pentapeptide synthase